MTLKTSTLALIETLKKRFIEKPHRHQGVQWDAIETLLSSNSSMISFIQAMEESGGEVDVVIFPSQPNEIYIVDCAKETPVGRRSLCYDEDARLKRKANPPQFSALGMAAQMGVQIMDEAMYHEFQTMGPFDEKSSSWLLTPDSLRSLGGALFGDYRYGRVFIYHNGADSYYSVRGFRSYIRIR